MPNYEALAGMMQGRGPSGELHGLRNKRKSELEVRAAMGTDRQAPALLKLLQGEMNEDPDTGLDAQKDVAQIENAQQAGKVYNLDENQQVRDDTQQTAMEKLLAPERMKGEYSLARQRIANEGIRGGGNKNDNILVQTLDQKSGMPKWTKRSEAAGMFTAGTGGERQAIKSNNNVLDLLDEVEARGSSNNWGGIGLTGPAQNWAYDHLGLGSSGDDDLRVVMQKLNADIMFGAGGKALTDSEREIAGGYLADIGSNPKAAKSKLAMVRGMIQRGLARAQGLEPDDQLQQDAEDEDLGPEWGNR
jgi:hypothetical protein